LIESCSAILDRTDKQVTGFLLNIEKKYWKLRMGQVDYSLEVQKAAET